MKILFIGGDKRTLEIINSFDDKDIIGFNKIGLDTVEINSLNTLEYGVIIFPVDGIKNDYTVTSYYNDIDLNLENIDFKIKKKCIVFSGIQTLKLDELFKNNYIKLMDFTDVALENSIPTAEGVISNIIENTDYTINNSNITVLGYGICGKTLVAKLTLLGANVNVGIIREKNDYFLIQNNIKTFYTNIDMKENIKNSDIIINTVPTLLLNENTLDCIKSDVYIIDISSYPYGIDFEYTKTKNIKTTLLPGIPGKTAPITSGKILAKKINNIIKEEN